MSEMNLTSPDSRRRVSEPAKQPFDPDPTCADTGDEVGGETGDEIVVGNETGDETRDVNLGANEPIILL